MVSPRQIAGHEIAQIGVVALFLAAVPQRARYRLSGEIVLGLEVTVESAMCQAGGAHDRVDTHTVEAFLAKHPRGSLHDALAVFRRLLSAHSHVSLAFIQHGP